MASPTPIARFAWLHDREDQSHANGGLKVVNLKDKNAIDIGAKHRT
jgi:hypothetical protein